MQIHHDLKVSSSPFDPKSLSLKEGDISSAIVKEKLPNNEAVVNIKGQEIRMKLQGEFAANEKIKIQIKDPQTQPPSGKIIERSPLPVAENRTQIQSQSIKFTNEINISHEMKAAIDRLLSKGIKISRESLTHIKNYIEYTNRTEYQKIETLDMLAKKQINITPSTLKSVDQALHGEGVAKQLDTLLKSADPEFDWSSVSDTIQKDREAASKGVKTQSDIDQLIQKAKISFPEGSSQQQEAEELINTISKLDRAAIQRLKQAIDALLKTMKTSGNLQMLSELEGLLSKGADIEGVVHQLNKLMPTEGEAESAESLVKDAVKLTNLKANLTMKLDVLFTSDGESSDIKRSEEQPIHKLLQQQIKAVQKEPDFNRVINTIEENVVRSSFLSDSQKSAVIHVLGKAGALFQSGKELVARQEVLKVLGSIEKQEAGKNQAAIASTPPQQQAEAYTLNDEILSMIPVQSKDIIVNTITKKLSQMAMDFKEFKNDISRNLQSVQQMIQQSKQRASITARPMLENTIKQLDQAILKSDFMLYTDMKTEKDLLMASSRLAEAKKLLAKGDYSSAHKIVHEVKTNVEKMIFKPSDVRVKHFVSKEILQYEPMPLSGRFSENIKHSVQAVSHEPSARQTFEYLRSLGLTHESEHAQSLVQNGKAKEDLQMSLKNILMKFNQSDSEFQGTAKGDQLLQNLTGQQLISKNDSSGLQNLMFTLPMLLKDQVEDVKVYINSKNPQQKVDWENCNLYFLIETQKLGEVGIALSSVDRTLSVQIRNDRDGFQKRMEPVADLARKRLEGIGYKIGSIQFSKLTKQPDEETKELRRPPHKGAVTGMTEKGYDFTI
ncbi:hypothetical protein ACOJQI_20170 [Bacillus salacetis]|uniref:hypothetical protein n=1 Tax=Bacillus salacetis TaxID=2315464 RepID=UPI003BA1046B